MDYSSGSIFVGEIIGTAILVLFGTGVGAAVSLRHSKANAAGWVAIAFGWGFGVMAGAYTAAPLSGGHINPAVTVGIAGESGDWSDVPVYFAGQLTGGMIGALLTWLAYFGQFAAQAEEHGALPTVGIFCTAPELRNPVHNLLTEIIATLSLVLPILAFSLTAGLAESGTGILIIALLVTGIGLSLGGPTGYAINPARDLGPRIVHALLPIPNKGSSDWSYSWVPVAGPFIGGLLAAGIFNLAF